MKAGAVIKALRVAVQGVCMTLLTMAFVGVPGVLFALAHGVVSLQLVPAVVSLALGIFVVWIIITIIFGRIYCSTVCPLGVCQDIVARLRRKRRYRYRPPRNAASMVILATVVICSIAGFSVILSLLDPYSQYGRMVANVISPSAAGVFIALVSAVVVGVMAWRGGRIYCNTVCPVGAALSLVSRTSFFRIDIDPDKCVRCRRCEHVCKSSCIDVEHSTVDFSRCVTCFNCLTVCDVGAIKYSPDRKQLSTPMFQRVPPVGRKAQPSAMNRRDFLVSVTTLAVTPLIAGCEKRVKSVKALGREVVVAKTTVAVTPPGAISRSLFLDRCTGCGMCISVCPSKVLKASTTQYGLLRALHPVMDYDAAYCLYDCNRCTEVCPAEALSPLTVEQKHNAPVGLASPVWPNCVHCGLCAAGCPVKAIEMKAQGDGAPVPVVDPNLCIGCGFCQNVCPATPYKAIIVEGLT